jgi:N-carbamoyl-L-amino-acid hydrolase
MLHPLRINPARFQSSFSALSVIGGTPEGGLDRMALGETHLAARRWFSEQISLTGLELHMDEAGNHSAILRSANPDAATLLIGSHLDSVLNGGRYDGALGVLAALETLRTIQDAGLALPMHLEAIDFTDEEGTLVGLLGSAALAGKLTPRDLQQPRGGRDHLLAGLARAGLSEAGLLTARRDPVTLAGYLELHIEQGPNLNRAGVNIGVVSGIVGIASYCLSVTGRANHAGTTPMADRLDSRAGRGRLHTGSPIIGDG